MVEIYINGTKIDVGDDIPMSINYSIADIREPDQRKQTHTKTISIPSSKTNDKLFTHIFEVNREGGFNPNTKADCLIFQDNIEQLAGSVQLTNITEVDEFNRTYDIVCYGQLMNLFNDIGKGRLEELDFSEFNHEWTQGNQINSWDTSIIQNSGTVAFSLGNGYVYPLIDYGYSTDQISFDVTELFPSLYVKTVIDKIFETHGYEYESSFFDSTRFKRLINPFCRNRFELSQSQIEQRLFRAESTGVASIDMTQPTYTAANSVDLEFTNDSTGLNFDNGGNYSSPEFTAPEPGYYDFVSKCFAGIQLTPVSGAVAVTPTLGTFKIFVRILKNGSQISSKEININLSNVPSFTTQYTSSGTVAQPDPDGIFTGIQFADFSNSFAAWTSNVFLDAGDVVKCEWFPYALIAQDLANQGLGINDKFELTSSPGTYMSGTYQARIMGSSIFYNKVTNTSIAEGGTVDMNTIMPVKILQRDYLKSIIQMFNLYLQQDPSNPKKYIIEPRDDFYSLGNNVDFTEKIDKGQAVKITPIGAINSGKYRFSYTEDKDYFNQKYTTDWGEIYGESDNDIQNDFLNNINETKVIFSPSPLADNGFSDLVMTRIVQNDPNGTIAPFASNIRILQYGGLKTINNTQWHHTSSVSGTVSSFQYPYAGHLDDPFAPSFDINFGVVKEVYYDDLFTPITWSDNNLYNVYYSKHIREITDPNTIMLTGMFYLTPYDIVNIDFKNQYWFKNAYWRLNAINGYNPTDNSLTECEFIKIKEAQAFQETTIDDIGQADPGVYNAPALPSFVLTNGNVGISNETININGKNNIVSRDAEHIDIIGSNNSIGAGTKNVQISGDGNSVLSGLENVSLINTSNATVEESNTVYVNGDLISGQGSTVVVTSNYTADWSSFILVDASSAPVLVTLPSSPVDGKFYNIKKIDSSSNQITIRPPGKNIDGIMEQFLISQYENLTVKWSASNDEYSII